MPRPRKKARSSSESDDEYAPPASARRPSIKVKPREQRDRRAPAAFSPTVDTPTRKPRKPKEQSLETDDNSASAPTPARPEHKRLENKIKSQAHRLRYPLAFIDAYEAEGWNKSSLDKLKPSKELDAERRKIERGQRALIDGLYELKALYANEPQVPPMAVFEDVHCSRCGSTDIEQDNDILLCDSVGCHRAYHQKCQTPIVLTAKIPAGDEPWFCEVCLAVFECLKSINSVFGTTYENVEDLFPELIQAKQATADASSSAQSEEESATATAPPDEDDEEENDEDFVLHDEESDEDEEEDDENEKKTEAGGEEEMAEEVPESAQDLLYLSKDDVIDVNHRSSRSKSAILPPKPVDNKVSLIGEPAAKIDPKTGEVILGVVAKLEPPSQGRYSRWRIDYRDGSSELLTRSKTQAAINRAAVADSDDEDGGDSEALIVRGKRKRNEVDYRQLNELMFAGKDEDSEEDETFEVKEESEEEPDEEEENEDDGEENEGEGKEESAESVSDQSSPTTVTASHAAVLQSSMHEGLLS